MSKTPESCEDAIQTFRIAIESARQAEDVRVWSDADNDVNLAVRCIGNKALEGIKVSSLLGLEEIDSAHILVRDLDRLGESGRVTSNLLLARSCMVDGSIQGSTHGALLYNSDGKGYFSISRHRIWIDDEDGHETAVDRLEGCMRKISDATVKLDFKNTSSSSITSNARAGDVVGQLMLMSQLVQEHAW